jgi:hypothetical protein
MWSDDTVTSYPLNKIRNSLVNNTPNVKMKAACKKYIFDLITEASSEQKDTPLSNALKRMPVEQTALFTSLTRNDKNKFGTRSSNVQRMCYLLTKVSNEVISAGTVVTAEIMRDAITNVITSYNDTDDGDENDGDGDKLSDGDEHGDKMESGE